MSWVAVGVGAATVIGGALQADASKSAANSQGAAATKANETQRLQLATNQQNIAPWQRAGNVGLDQLMYMAGLGNKPGSGTITPDAKTAVLKGNKAFTSTDDAYLGRYGIDQNAMTLDQIAPTWGVDRVVDMNGNVVWGKGIQQDPNAAPDPMKGSLLKPFGMEDFQASPAYQFNLAEGQKAINKQAAARGKYYAPGTLQDISKFSQGLASNEFQNAYSNYNTNMGNIWSRLSTLSGGGQNAAAGLGTNASQVAGQVGNNIVGAGNASAAGQVGQANAVNQGLGSAYNNYVMSQILAQNQQSTVPSGGAGILPGAGDMGGNFA